MDVEKAQEVIKLLTRVVDVLTNEIITEEQCGIQFNWSDSVTKLSACLDKIVFPDGTILWEEQHSDKSSN